MERFLLFVALGGAAAYAQAAAQAAALTGRVVDGVTKAEVRKATVYATQQQSSTPQSGALSFRPPTTFSAVTDAEGVFRFPAIAAGKYTLRAEKPGYLPFRGKSRLDTTAVTGQETAVGELELLKQGVIAGRVTDAEGEPIEHANVQVIGTRRQGTDLSAMTDDRGEFRIPRLAAGAYRLLATKPPPSQAANAVPPGEQLLVNAPTYYPSAAEESAASTITLAAGEERTGIEIRLRRTPAVRVAGRLAGEIPPNTPAYMSMMPAGARRFGGANQFGAIAGSDGSFVFHNVTPGDYFVHGNLHQPGGVKPLSGVTRVSVGPQDIEDLTVVMAPLVRITGRVRAEGGAKLPAEQVSIGLRPMDMGLPGGWGGRVKPDGTFVIENLQRQRYGMGGNAPKGWYLKALSAGGQRQPELEFDVTGAEMNLELVYSDRPGAVSVTLEGSPEDGGQTIAVAIPEGARQLTNLYKAAHIAAETKVVKIDDVPPGNYQIVACPSSLVPSLAEDAIWERVKAKATAVKVEEGGTVSAAVRPIVESDLDEK
ncbi:MAG: carboxypeptidase regulatory-like domain-containing protein [Bryobacterales bacterium]|nr:carboxypeptidase regulatory-like domain-containing protein [Bryobacterales bacterium]